MKCKTCKGTGKQRLSVDAEEVDGMEGPCRYTIFVSVRCEKCNGKGRLREEDEE